MADHNKLGDTLFYLYDLPKDSVTSIQIHEAFSKIGIDIKTRPQIKRAHFTPFYSAKVKLNNVTDMAKAKKEFKYPKICGRQARGLPWIPNVVGQDKRTQLIKNNIFYKFKDRNMEVSYEDLEAIFSKFGEVQSIKIPIDQNYKQKGFAYIMFAKEEDAERCRREMKSDEGVMEFKQSEPKTEDDKIGNNLYIKNFANWSDDDVRKLFEQHGKISNFAIKANEFGRYGFVCYDDPEKKDKEYGKQCAKNAIEALKEKVMDDNNTKLYIKGFLNMEMRKREKEKETFRFKQSLKRCNLFVKNFPPEWKEEDILNVFSQYGKIDKVKLNATNNRTGQAFVCFSTPEEAARARSNLNMNNYSGHQIQIVGYELKEDRDLMLEDVRDRKDWENFMSMRGELNTSLAHQPNLAHIIQNLLQLIQQQNSDGLKRGPMRGGPKQPGGGRGGMKNMHQGGHYNQNMGMMPPNMGMMQPPQVMQQQQQQIPPPNASPEMIFNHKVREIIPAVQDKNPYLKETVGNFIYDYVLQMCGEHRAPKVTGMLIALNAQNIKDYLQSYQHLQAKVNEAVTELDSQPPQQQ